MAQKIQNDTESFAGGLTGNQETAALLVAEDKLTDEQIADSLSVTRVTIARWKIEPGFKKRVEEHREAWRQHVMSSGIADKAKRIEALNARWELQQKVIDCRAARNKERRADGQDEVPEEAETGLVVLEKTYTKNGVTEKWAVDTPHLAEMRNTELQAARELGQLVEKHEVETRDTTTRESLKRKLVSVATTVRTTEVSG